MIKLAPEEVDASVTDNTRFPSSQSAIHFSHRRQVPVGKPLAVPLEAMPPFVDPASRSLGTAVVAEPLIDAGVFGTVGCREPLAGKNWGMLQMFHIVLRLLACEHAIVLISDDLRLAYR